MGLDPRARAGISRSSEGVKDALGILKVLVVDDAKMNLKLLMRLVSKKGHKVDGAEDGEVAIEKALQAMEAHADYDVILMDYQMPNIDGPTATRILRSKGCNAFICGVTGNVMAEDVKHFKDCGADEVLPKPAKIKALEDLWIEYGLRGESRTEEGAYDGIIEPKPKVDCSGEMSGLSISSLDFGTKSNSRVDMTRDVVDAGASLGNFAASKITLETTPLGDSDIWASKRSSK